MELDPSDKEMEVCRKASRERCSLVRALQWRQQDFQSSLLWQDKSCSKDKEPDLLCKNVFLNATVYCPHNAVQLRYSEGNTEHVKHSY